MSAEGKGHGSGRSCVTEIQTLWFGGTIPYSRGERGKNVPAVNGTGQPDGRTCGLPECLRTCGVWEYPLATGGNVFIGRDASRSRGIIPKVGARTSCSCLQGESAGISR